MQNKKVNEFTLISVPKEALEEVGITENCVLHGRKQACNRTADGYGRNRMRRRLRKLSRQQNRMRRKLRRVSVL